MEPVQNLDAKSLLGGSVVELNCLDETDTKTKGKKEEGMFDFFETGATHTGTL